MGVEGRKEREGGKERERLRERERGNGGREEGAERGTAIHVFVRQTDRKTARLDRLDRLDLPI